MPAVERTMLLLYFASVSKCLFPNLPSWKVFEAECLRQSKKRR